MIKNEREYRITRAQVRRLTAALQEMTAPERKSALPPAIVQAQRDALASQLSELEAEVRAYEELKGGNGAPIVVKSLDELPQALVMARIAAHITQKELAARLALQEQQIQRYEATGYARASLARLREIAQVLNVSLEIVLKLGTSSGLGKMRTMHRPS